MDTSIIIDNSSFNFYRVSASIAWYRKFKPGAVADINNDEFVKHMESQYIKHIEKLEKKFNIKRCEFLIARDSHSWRHKIYDKYKHKRSSNSVNGPLIKHLNETFKDHFKQVVRVELAEADDIIATYVKYNQNKNIFIIANDSDYDQLYAYSNVSIYKPKNIELVSIKDETPSVILFNKIVNGDTSDNIPACCSNKKVKVELLNAIKLGECSLISCLLKNMDICPDIYDKYLLNRELIDFNYIPRSLQMEIMKAFDPKMVVSKINLGLCCINTQLKDLGIFCSRKPILRTVEAKGLDYLRDQCIKNCLDMLKMIEWNHKNGIKVLRITSGLFPHYSNPRLTEKYNLDFAQEYLTDIGNLARKYGQRLTFHPGQYNVVASPNESAWNKTLIELDMHAEILDRMSCGVDSVMVVHGGGLYGDKEKTINRWIERFSQLSARVRRRLVLENCEKIFSIVDCIRVSKACNIPVVFDSLHHKCYILMHKDEKLESPEFYIPDILKSWYVRGIRPKFHVSEQAVDGKTGKHSDMIEELPEYMLNLSDIDIMIEAKHKELAIASLHVKYVNIL